MTDAQKPTHPDSLDRDRRIDSICDEFEKLHLTGERPQIEAFLDRVDGPTKQPLLIELIAIDMHCRRSRGESIAIEHYQARFPGLSAERLDATIQLSMGARLAAQPNKIPSSDLPTLDSNGQPMPPLDREIVKYFGDYEILSTIARGGMGVVYKARQISLNRIVALKMILSGEFASKEEVDRFYSEAKAAALLDHPGIVPIYEVGEHGGKHFFSMTYVEGSSLAAKLNDGPLDPLQAANMMLEVSQAVHYAHEKGVIHRDLKPSNILLDLQGHPRVTDFGLAKRMSEDTGMTVSGQVLGTPSYMPPEQAAGQVNTIGPASDVYGLGAVLYSLTTGRPPFQAASKIDTLRQVVEKEPVAPRQLNPTIPRDLETIILTCLEKSLPRRYGTAKELSDELKRFAEGRPILARPIGRVAKVWRWCRRQPMVASLLAAVFLSLVAGISVSSFYAIKESKERKEQERQKNIANEATRQAESARDEKEIQAEIAEQERDKAKASETKTRRNLYVSDAARVEELVKESNLVRAKTLLERHIPTSADEEDLRGFDWYYHWRQVSQQKARFDFMKPVEVIDLSADEKTVAVGCEGGRAYLLDLESGKVQDTAFSIDDEHWSNIAFVAPDRLIGHGQQGSFKQWDRNTAETLATKPSLLAVESKKVGSTYEDRIPASVSKDGMKMICSDLANNLALWDLTSMRPRPIPYINDGLHAFKKQGRVISLKFAFHQEKLPYFSPRDEKMLTVTGHRDWNEFDTRWFADEASKEYSQAGTVFQSLAEQSFVSIGHPITTISFSNDRKLVLTGNTLGEIQLWNTNAIEDLSRWIEVMTQSRSLGKLPIRSVNLSPFNQRFAVCDDKQCWVYGMSDLNPILKIDAKDTSFLVARFIGNDLVAVGTSSGLVDLWRVSDSKLVKRLFVGQGEIREILADKTQKSLYVASSEGCIISFELNENPSPLVPQRNSYSPEKASVIWLPLAKRIAFHRAESDELVLVDPSNPEQLSALDLKVPGVFRRRKSNPVLFRERKNGSEVVSLHEEEINVWNLESMALVKKLDTRQHVDDSGRIHPIALNRHPYKGLSYRGGVFTEQPNLPGNSNGVVSADLFSDERRLAMVGNAVGLQLIHRDIDTGKVLSELRILGASAEIFRTTVTCLDEQRVLVNEVRLLADKKFVNSGLVWNTSDNSLTVVDTTLKSNALTVATNAFRGQLQVMNQVKERKEIGFWDRTAILILDSDSLTPVVEAGPPEKAKIDFAHLDSNGDVHAVLSVLNALGPEDFGWASGDLHAIRSALKDFRPEDFRWARWNRESNEWQTVFSWKEKKRETSPDMRFSFDPAQSVLYYMQDRDSGSFRRWSTKDGIELPAMQIPFGSVESFQLNQSGMGVALLKSKVTVIAAPWSVTWYSNGIRRSQNLDNHSPFVLPLPAKEWWLTESGVRPGALLDMLEPRPIRFDGKELEHSKPNSQLLCSDNHLCLVQIVSGTLHYWLLSEDTNGKSKFVYRYAGARSATDEEVVKASLTPKGNAIAISTGSEMRWSVQPFQEWQRIQLNAPTDAKITSLRWSWDNKTIAVGFSSGDVILHDVENESSNTLARGHHGAVHDSLWLPDRRSIATAGNDGTIVFWDLSQMEIRMRLEAHKGAVKTLAYDPSKSTLYSGGEDGLIRRWIAASNHSTDPQLPNRFVAPDPISPIEETIAAPSASVLQNRGIVQWLKSLDGNYGLASFGMQLRGSARDDQLDAMSVHTISFRAFPNVQDDDLARLSGLTELRSLDLSSCKLSAAGIGKLKRLVGLHTLDLSGIDLSAFDFELLKDSANLRTLTLNRCSISDEQFLAIIRLFPRLSELEVSMSPLTDVSVSKIDSLMNLKTLVLASSKITDESLTAIRTLKMLEQLDLSDTKVSGDNLSQLESLTLLKNLRIKGVPARNDWITKLVAGKSVAWENMKFLDIRDSAITSIGALAFLGRRKNVDTYVSPGLFGEYPEIEALLQLGPLRGTIQVDGKPLDVLKAIAALKSGGSITGLTWPIDKKRSVEDVEVLAKLPKLERIEVSADAMPTIHFPILPRVKGLIELEIPGSASYSGNQFVGEIQQLRRLILASLSESQLSQLQKLKNLESLEYTSGVRINILAKALPQLKSLACPEQYSKELTEAISFLRSLETLTTVISLVSSQKDFGPILSKLKNLKRLNIQFSYSAPDLKKLQAALPGVTVESIKKK